MQVVPSLYMFRNSARIPCMSTTATPPTLVHHHPAPPSASSLKASLVALSSLLTQLVATCQHVWHGRRNRQPLYSSAFNDRHSVPYISPLIHIYTYFYTMLQRTNPPPPHTHYTYRVTVSRQCATRAFQPVIDTLKFSPPWPLTCFWHSGIHDQRSMTFRSFQTSKINLKLISFLFFPLFLSNDSMPTIIVFLSHLSQRVLSYSYFRNRLHYIVDQHTHTHTQILSFASTSYVSSSTMSKKRK